MTWKNYWIILALVVGCSDPEASSQTEDTGRPASDVIGNAGDGSDLSPNDDSNVSPDEVEQRRKLRYSRRFAIVVGVSDYQRGSDVPTAIYDAYGVKRMLNREFGFGQYNTLLLTDQAATQNGILNAIDEWLIKERNPEINDLVLFFFSGHGVKKSGVSYLVPSDADGQGEPSSLVSLDDIVNRFGKLDCHRAVVVDACDAGHMFRKSRVDSLPDDSRSVRVTWDVPDDEPELLTDAARRTYMRHSAFQGLSASRLKSAEGDAVEKEMCRRHLEPMNRWRENAGYSPFTASLLRVMESRANSQRPGRWFSFSQFAEQVEAMVPSRFPNASTPQWGVLGNHGLDLGNIIFEPTIARSSTVEEQRAREQARTLNKVQQLQEVGEFGSALEELSSINDDDQSWEWRYLQAVCDPHPRIVNDPFGRIISFSVSQDGKRIATLTESGQITIWNLQRLTEVWTFPMEGVRGTGDLTLSSDGTVLAAVGSGGLVHVWSVDDKKYLHRLIGERIRSDTASKTNPAKGYFQVAMNADGSLIAAVGEFRVRSVKTRLWSVWSGKTGMELYSETGQITGIDVDDDVVTVARRDGLKNEHRVYSFHNAQHARDRVILLFKGKQSLQRTHCVAFSPDHRWFACGVEDGVWMWIRYPKLEERTAEVRRLPNLAFGKLAVEDPVQIQFSRDGNSVAVLNRQNKISVWELTLTTMKLISQFPTIAATEAGMEFHPNQRNLIVADGPSLVLADPVRAFHTLSGSPGAEEEFGPIRFMEHDGIHLISYSKGRLSRWLVDSERMDEDFQELHFADEKLDGFHVLQEEIIGGNLADDYRRGRGHTAIWGCRQYGIYYTDLATGYSWRARGPLAGRFACTSDCIVTVDRGQLTIRNLLKRDLPQTNVVKGWGVHVATSHDGKHAVMVGDESVAVTNVRYGETLKQFRLQNDGISKATTFVAFNPDGNTIAIGRLPRAKTVRGLPRVKPVQGVVEIWNWQTATLLVSIPGVLASIDKEGRRKIHGSAVYSRDGRRIFLPGSVEVRDVSTGVRLLDLAPGEGGFTHLAISDDDKRLAAARRNQIRVWMIPSVHSPDAH